jgi:TRAP transporter TAXI family solute receptor
MLSFRMMVSPRETRGGKGILCWRGLACASLLFFALLCSALAETETRFFRIGTAATGGSFFEIGGVLASAISGTAETSGCGASGNCGVPGLVAVAQATQGSVENLRLLNSGQIESVFAQADLAAMAYGGTGAFADDAPMRQLRAIGGMFPEALHVVVRVDSPIRELADLAGKTVSLGEEGSGTVANAKVLLSAAGFGDDDVTRKFLRPNQAAEEIKAGTVDALILAGGVPVPAISELAQVMPIRLIPITGLVASELQRHFGFYGPTVIRAGSYRNVDTDIRSVGFYALWLVRADCDADLVYDITRAAWSEPAAHLFAALDPIGKEIRLENALKGISLPLHPAAERFYRERGLRVDGLPIADEPGERVTK